MKTTKKTDDFTEKEWEELAAHFSGEKYAESDLIARFGEEDSHYTGKKWEELNEMNSDKEQGVDVNKAWNNLLLKINEDTLVSSEKPSRIRTLSNSITRIAAAALILIGLGSAVFYFTGSGAFSKKITLASGNDQNTLVADLPDGSRVFLNRNSEFSYRSNFGKKGRNVKLTGEAFFEIAPDKSKPFIIDAGRASIKVVGTSFNVITSNNESAVEVFVKTGRVELSDNTGSHSITLDPGYVGTIDEKIPGKRLNNNINYMAWKDRILDYNGQKLDVVFNDLKRVYNMDIVAENQDILENSWTSPIYNQSPDTIIQIICVSFNLSYSKDGNVYRLIKK